MSQSSAGLYQGCTNIYVVSTSTPSVSCMKLRAALKSMCFTGSLWADIGVPSISILSDVPQSAHLKTLNGLPVRCAYSTRATSSAPLKAMPMSSPKVFRACKNKTSFQPNIAVS